MQATVASYDEQTRSGTVLLDDGTPLSFPSAALEGSGLRRLRLGQRVRLRTAPDGTVVGVQILTLT